MRTMPSASGSPGRARMRPTRIDKRTGFAAAKTDRAAKLDS
jgi:hypothetical protein